MLNFLLGRIGQSLTVLLAASAIAFAMFQFTGDPVQSMLGPEASVEDRQNMRTALGLNDPMIVQYGRFIARAIQGEFGVSYLTQEPVSSLITRHLQATIELALVAGLLAILIAVPLGIFVARYRQSMLAQLVQVLSLVGISVPTFVTGVLLILVFSVWLRWLPAFGRGELDEIGGWSTGLLTESGLRSLIMPAVTLCLYPAALIMRLIRAEILQVLRSDHIRFARARGLTGFAIYYRHALKNALLPAITIIGLEMGSLVAFSIIVEVVFSWPGIGLLFIDAMRTADVPVLSAYLLTISLMFVLINIAVDLTYSLIDPRLRRRSS